MATMRYMLGLICAMVSMTYAAKLIDPSKCQNGCQSDQQCPLNSECILLGDKENCGFCVCAEGFKAQGNKCAKIKGYSTSTTSTTTTPTTSTSTTTESTTTSMPETSTTTTETTTTSTLPTTTGTTTQGPPPIPEPVYCPDFACTVAPPSETTDDNPFQVRSQLVNVSSSNSKCKRQLLIPPRPCNVQGGGQCHGSYCLTVTPGNDYCICPYYRVDRQCAVDKPGKCEVGTGDIPRGLTTLQNRRLRNPSNKDHGSVYARHFAGTLNDCIKLCQWTQGSCRSVNYGQIGGTNVCELLSIAATEKNLLAPWLEQASGWTYAQLVQSF